MSSSRDIRRATPSEDAAYAAKVAERDAVYAAWFERVKAAAAVRDDAARAALRAGRCLQH